MKQTLKIGIMVFVVAAMAMSGIALAQTDETTEQEQNAVTRIAEHLQELVDNGTLTADQAEAVAEFLAENAPRGRRGGHGPGKGLAGVAEFLGMEAEEFRAALQEYDTLGAIADANGSSAAELIDYMVGQAEERIAQAVADGKLTQAEADEKLAELEDKITEKVNSEIPEPGEGRQGRRGGPGGDGAGFGGQPPVDATA
jgi:polyhydroxyalkanoate synthesis regulator phasin